MKTAGLLVEPRPFRERTRENLLVSVIFVVRCLSVDCHMVGMDSSALNVLEVDDDLLCSGRDLDD